jgi:hypothetical protein
VAQNYVCAGARVTIHHDPGRWSERAVWHHRSAQWSVMRIRSQAPRGYTRNRAPGGRTFRFGNGKSRRVDTSWSVMSTARNTRVFATGT